MFTIVATQRMTTKMPRSHQNQAIRVPSARESFLPG
jgi:hypothetical protein